MIRKGMKFISIQRKQSTILTSTKIYPMYSDKLSVFLYDDD